MRRDPVIGVGPTGGSISGIGFIEISSEVEEKRKEIKQPGLSFSKCCLYFVRKKAEVRPANKYERKTKTGKLVREFPTRKLLTNLGSL